MYDFATGALDTFDSDSFVPSETYGRFESGEGSKSLGKYALCKNRLFVLCLEPSPPEKCFIAEYVLE